MRDLRRFIKSNNIIMRLTSLILTVAILASALVYLGNEKMDSVSAADGTERTYMEYMVQRLIDGLQDEFNVLEIVPYIGQGQFGQFTADADNAFTNQVLAPYKTLISEVLTVNTVEANNLKESDIARADLIIINTGANTAETIRKYRELTGDNSKVVFTKDGVEIADNGVINYNTFEKVHKDDVVDDSDDIVDTDVPTDIIYFNNNKGWGYVYAFYRNSTTGEKVDIPGVEMTLVEGDIYSIEIPTNVDYIGFTNGTQNQIINEIKIEGFNKVYFDGVWRDYPLDPEKYEVTLPAVDTNVRAIGEAEATEGSPYSVVLTPAEGYVVLDTFTVTIAEVEYNGYTYNSETGEIIIPASDVTGKIAITATAAKAEELQKYAITLPTDANIESTGNEEVLAGKIYSAVLTAKESYKLPDTIEIKVGDVLLTSEEYIYDKESGKVTIKPLPNTDSIGDVINVVITATAAEIPQIPVSDYVYVTRDMSWSMCQKLLDSMINGRELEMADGYTQVVKTPVIINNDGIADLNKDTNMYKLMYIYRMCGAARWEVLKDYLVTSSNGTKYRNEDGIVTPVIKKENTGLAEDAVKWNTGNDNPIKALFGSSGAASGRATEEYYEENLFSENHLSDDYWVTKNNNWISADGIDDTINGVSSNTAFTSRVEGNITGINVLKYLLGIKSDQIYSFDEKLRVLEIQPCNSFDYDVEYTTSGRNTVANIDDIEALGSALLRTGAESWSADEDDDNYYGNYLEIDYMTPNELNGIKDDIASNYDVVIIGDNIDIMTQSGGKTIYNDRNLNGYIYLAFGDLYKISTNMLGFLPDEYIELTDAQSKDNIGRLLKDSDNKSLRPISTQHIWTPYVYSVLQPSSTKSGYYIVQDMYQYYVSNLADRKINEVSLGNSSKVINNNSFYMDYYLGNTRLPDNDITDITKEKLEEFVKTGNPIIVADSVYDADRTKLYPTSDMYDFASTILRDTNGNLRRNVVNENAIGRAVAYLGAKAPKISFLSGEVDVITRTNRTTAAGNIIYDKVPTSDMPLKPVEPEYTSPDGGVVKTFNGKTLKYGFRITGQINATYKIKLLVDKNNDGVYADNPSSEENNEVYFSEIITLTNTRTKDYSITAQLSDDFRGMLSWKLVVVQLDGDDETPYRVEEKGYSAIFRGDENSTPLIIKDTDLDDIDVLQIYPGVNNLDLTSSTFTTLFQNVAESVGYRINVQKVSVDTFNQWYESRPYSPDSDPGSDRLSDKEMIVFGFADSFNHQDISNDYGAMDNIMDFIDDGKAVLLSHDTLSWRSTPNYASGYVSNSGVFTYSGGYQEMVGIDGDGDKVQFQGYRMQNTSPTLTFMLRNRAGMDKYGVTLKPEEREGKEVPEYEAVDGDDTTYRPNYATNDSVRELQGFNSWMLWRIPFLFRHMNNQDGVGDNYYTLRTYSSASYLYYNTETGSDCQPTDNWKTTKATCLNKGPVTLYPYNIGNTLLINETHGQYFELDMEDEEVVVWYTLSQKDTDIGNSEFYGITENDAANNYYIYSKGNITYSGAGHDNMEKTDWYGNKIYLTEYKLFVNTIVKAIAGGNSVPTINVTNGSVVTDGSYIVYVNSTYDASQYELDFNATDPDLISYAMTNKNIELVGAFTKAEIYWWNPDSAAWELIKDSTYQAINKFGESLTTTKLKNGMQQNLTLQDTTLGGDANKLRRIEELVEEDEVGAKFKIVVEDSSQGTASVEIVLHVRDLFNMN